MIGFEKLRNRKVWKISLERSGKVFQRHMCMTINPEYGVEKAVCPIAFLVYLSYL